MQVKDIITLEKDNFTNIYLLREGLFWRAYENSAYLFTNHIKAYQLIKKYFKNVGCDIVYCGFPNTALNELLEKHNNLELIRQDKIIKIGCFEPIENEVFSKWKFGISLVAEESKPQYVACRNNHHIAEKIIERIRNFNVANSTPMQCQELLIKLQDQLDGTL